MTAPERQCPRCASIDVHRFIKSGTAICAKCGHVWRPTEEPRPAETKEPEQGELFGKGGKHG